MKPSTTSQKEFFRPLGIDISDEQAKEELVYAMLLMIAKILENEGNMELASKYREYVTKKRRG
jgi:hypothetical protein